MLELPVCYQKEPPTSCFMTRHLLQTLPPCSRRDPFPLLCPVPLLFHSSFLFPAAAVILQHTSALCGDLARVLPGQGSLNFSLTLTLEQASFLSQSCLPEGFLAAFSEDQGQCQRGSTAQSVHTRPVLTASSQRCKA